MNVAPHRRAPDQLCRRYAGTLYQGWCYDIVNSSKAAGRGAIPFVAEEQ